MKCFILKRVQWALAKEATEYVVLVMGAAVMLAAFYAWLGWPGVAAILTGAAFGCALTDNDAG